MGRIIKCSLVAMLVLSAGVVAAQEWSSDQLEVWTVITSQWEMEKNKDASWTKEMLHDDFVGWSDENPMPRDKAATARWNAYSSEMATVHMQQLNPVAIVVTGSTAVAHYYYAIAAEDTEGEHETTYGRYTDVLVKTPDGWKFLAWRGGDDPRFNSDDD